MKEMVKLIDFKNNLTFFQRLILPKYKFNIVSTKQPSSKSKKCILPIIRFAIYLLNKYNTKLVLS